MVDTSNNKYLIDTIDHFISGDWGADEASDESPKAVRCIRGADINSVNAQSFENVPIRYVAESSTDSKQLQAGDIIIEKSGGSPTQSTGRVAFISQKCIDRLQSVVCSNFLPSKLKMIGIQNMFSTTFNWFITTVSSLTLRAKHQGFATYNLKMPLNQYP